MLSVPRNFTKRTEVRYGTAILAVAVGYLLRQVLTAAVGEGLPTYITFYPAVMVAALAGGLGPGCLSTALTALVVDYTVLPPAGFGIASPVERVGMVLFVGMGLFMSAVAELYQRRRRKAAAYDQEVALRETRREAEFLGTILEHSSQPFAVGYPDGRLGIFNRAYAQLTGYTAAELRTLDWSNTLTPPEWRELEKEKLEELHRANQPVRYEKEYVRKDGSRVPIELLVHLVRDPEGRPDYYHSFIADITERKRIEETLRFLAGCGSDSSGEGFFQALARYLAQALAMDYVCIDRLEEGLLTAQTLAVFHQGQFESNVSYTLRDTPCGAVVGQKVCCFPRNVRGLFPKDAALDELAAESYVGVTLWSALGRPIGLIAVIGRQPLKDTRLAESILQVVAVRAASELERQQAEAALRRAKEEWERTFDAVPDLIAILDEHHRVVRANRTMAERLGLSPDECLGQPCHKAVHGTDGPLSDCPHQRTLADGREHSLELHESRLGGDFLVTTTPLKGESGRQVGSVHVARDISAHKRAERELRESNEELALFNRAAVGRELRMIELKKEVNALCARMGQAPRYELEVDEGPSAS